METEEITVEGTLVPFYIRSLKNELLAVGPGRPGRLAQAIQWRLVEDSEETVGLDVEIIEKEVIPYLRDMVFGGADDRYVKFVDKYLTPLGIDGRIQCSRARDTKQEELF